MKIKYLKKNSISSIPLTNIDRSIKEEYSKVLQKFIKDDNTLKVKYTFQTFRFYYLFQKCLYVPNSNGSKELITEDEFKQQYINYKQGFLKGYNDALLNNTYSNSLFGLIDGRFEHLYRLPKEYHGERYLITNEPLEDIEFYDDEKGRLTEYINFCFYDYGYEVGEYIARWDTLLNYYVNGGVREVSLIKKDKIIKDLPNDKKQVKNTELVSLFEHTSKYKKVLDTLVSKTKVDGITYLWVDLNNGHKKELASLIKHFQIKGYYWENKMPTDIEIKEICKNTFGINVGISTVNHSKGNDFDFNYIPYASTLNNKDNKQSLQ